MTITFTDQDVFVIFTAVKKLAYGMLVLLGGACLLAFIICILAYFFSDSAEEPEPSKDPTDDPEYQKFVEEMSKHCHCQPPHDFPCAGVLAGGPCDGMGEHTEGEQEP